MNRKQLANVVNALAAAYNRPVNQALLEAYWIGLSDFDAQDLERAAAEALRVARFMPTVAELRALAGELPPDTRAVYAWDAAMKAVDVVGAGRSVDFDDVLVNATLRNMGGWPRLHERIEAEGREWVRKDFERVYITLARGGITAGQAAALGGEYDLHNTAHGFGQAVRPPVLVKCGLPPAAKSIAATGRQAMPRIEGTAAAIATKIGKLPEE